MRFKYKLLALVILILAVFLGLFFGYPRGLSLILSYKKQCKVLRVDQFLKAVVMTGPGGQAQKFSIICDDGSVCRAEDTGFAGVKVGDDILFRGFPEFGSFEELGKCDHAQLISIKPQVASAVNALPPPVLATPAATAAGTIKVPGVPQPH